MFAIMNWESKLLDSDFQKKSFGNNASGQLYVYLVAFWDCFTPFTCIIGVLKFLFTCLSCGLFAVLVLVSHFSSPPLASFAYFFVGLKPFIYALCARPSTSRPPVPLALLCPSCCVFCIHNMTEFIPAPTCCVALNLIPVMHHALRSH